MVSFKEWFPEALRSASKVLAVGPGGAVFTRGDPTVGFYEVLSGRVRLARPTVTGQHVTLYVARDGDFLAEASLFSNIYHCDATALVPSEVRVYPKDLVLAEFHSQSDFAKAYIAMISRALIGVRVRNERLVLHSARERIWHYLLLNANSADHTVTVKGPLKDLAAELGMTHEVLYRTLARMEDEHAIERTDNAIRLINLE